MNFKQVQEKYYPNCSDDEANNLLHVSIIQLPSITVQVTSLDMVDSNKEVLMGMS